MAQSGSSPDDRQSIGAYEIQGPLGRGGMGEVFLAWDARLRRRVAIKRVRADRQLDTPSRERLLREARAAAGLSHPAIVQVYDLIEDAEGDCIVLEYVEGKTLAAELAGGPLDPARAVRLAREIAEGLAAAHEAGIVHRDLKAENVIVTPSGHAKILDFGLARLRTLGMDEAHLTQDGVLLGTFHVMSPEQASGGETDERSDLFSLGILLYEMLTGLSPFRGATPSETLKRVLFERPPRVDAVRPDLPVRLGDLVESLLSKEPAARPDSAAEVAHELEAVAASLASFAAPTWNDSVSSLPTVVEIPRPASTPPLPRNQSDPASKNDMSAVRKTRMRMVVVALLGVVVVGILAVLLALRFREQQPEAPIPKPPLRVLVLQPEVDNKDDQQLKIAAGGVLWANLGTLASLEGVAPIDPSELNGFKGSTSEMAQFAGADEVLISKLEKTGASATVTLRRVSGKEGRFLWGHRPVTIETQNLDSLRDTVSMEVRQAFASYVPRPGTPPHDVNEQDYAAFLKIEERVDSGQSLSQPEFVQLKHLLDRSPHFLEARLLAADLCNTLFQSTRDTAYLDDGFQFVREAKNLSPGDPQPLQMQFKLETAAGRMDQAEETLAALERLPLGDPQLLPLRAELKEKEGRLSEALSDREHAFNLVPSWQNLYFLANLEARVGRVAAAREDIEKILGMSQGNLWALEKKAEIELLFGEPERAKEIYQELITRVPKATYYTNLGDAQVFMGQYREAIDSFSTALKKEPNNIAASLDLAEAEFDLGLTDEARKNYRRALGQLEKNTPAGGLPPASNMILAQCLAHLDRKEEAKDVAQKALQKMQDDPNMLQQAAYVFAVAGDRKGAMDCIRKALDRRVQPRWFKLPAFASLCSDREYQSLVGQCAGGHLLSMTPGDGTIP